jgi:lambda repressor-like predicted transcriptional regulator
MKELAVLYDVHRTTIAQSLHKLAVPLRRQGVTGSSLAEAMRLYEEGWSLAKIGRKYGCSHATVRTAFIRAGVKLRPRRGWRY